jgi:hypothetical protein
MADDLSRDPVPRSGRYSKPLLNTATTFRLPAPLLEEVRRLAARNRVSAGEWIRQAVTVAVLEHGKPPLLPGYRQSGWQCPHATITAGATLYQVSCIAGCTMTPVYELLPTG